MHKKDITPEIVEGIYYIFNSVCKPRRLSYLGSRLETVEEAFPPESLAIKIRNLDPASGGIDMRISSEYAPFGPKLHFNVKADNSVEVYFAPNFDKSNSDEARFIIKAEEIADYFSCCIKSYFRKIDKLSNRLKQ